MLVRKATGQAAGDGFDFIMSDATVDRYGDIIDPAGWQLSWFKKNPIALFNHDSDFPIGRWENVRVEAGKLMARLVLATEGTSARVDEIRRLMLQGILRAASVGFRPLKGEPIEGGRGGYKYTEQELLECSLVSIPANPNALQLAKSLNVSEDTLQLVFGKHATTHEERTVTPGRASPATPSPIPQAGQGTGTMTLAERIAAAQARLVGLQDQQRAHIESMADEPTAEQTARLAELNGQISAAKAALEGLQAAERSLAGGASGGGQGTDTVGGGNGTDNVTRGADGGGRGHGNLVTTPTFAAPAQKVKPSDHVFRALAVVVRGHADKGRSRVDVLREAYGENDVSTATKAVLDMVTRAASTPADTVTPSWAGVLVQQAISEFYDLLLPQSVYPGLAQRGVRVGLGRNGSVSLPRRSATPTVAGSFVGEGAPIPVRQAGFSAVTLGRKKLGVITTMTREIMEASTPAIETILRDAMQEDTSVALDSVLLDANAATTIRPAGIRSGVAAVAATAGGGYAALVGDIKALMGALITSSNGNVRRPVWLMNPIQALAIGLTQNNGGDFPFAAEMDRGVLRGIPVIQSATVPAGTLMLVDAADFFTVTGDDPRFDMSDQATIHMEDTAPTAIGVAGTPNAVAAPVRSLFQTDTVALRMMMDVNWAFRRTGGVAWTEAVTW